MTSFSGMRRVQPSWVVLAVCGCAGGVGADPPDWPPPATISGADDGDDADAARVDGHGSSSGELPGSSGDASATSSEEPGDTGTVPPDLGAPVLDTSATADTGERPMLPSCSGGTSACASCGERSCCAPIQEAAADPEASCISACMLDGGSLPACGSQCDTVDPFGEPGITDLFVCLADECAGDCGSA